MNHERVVYNQSVQPMIKEKKRKKKEETKRGKLRQTKNHELERSHLTHFQRYRHCGDGVSFTCAFQFGPVLVGSAETIRHAVAQFRHVVQLEHVDGFVHLAAKVSFLQVEEKHFRRGS